jgi:hypothetical protein
VSAQSTRLLIAVTNLLIVALIALLGVRSFRGGATDPAEVPPTNFNPLEYDIPMSTGGQSSEREHRVTWLQFDRPEKVVITPVASLKLPPPRPQDLSDRYSLVMANYDPANESASSVILKGPSGPKALGVGDKIDGFTIKSIKVAGRGDTRVASVTIINRGRETTIQLKQKPK